MLSGDAFDKSGMTVVNDPLWKSSESKAAGVDKERHESPLNAQQYSEIQMAQQRGKKLRRAMGVARLDAWISACFAAVTLLSAVLSPWSLVLGAALALVAFNSFRGSRLFSRFEVRAPRILAWNQMFLATIIIVYSLVSLWDARNGSSELSDAIAGDAGLQQMMGDIKPMLWELSLALYGSIIAATVVTQGLTGLYYKSREKYVTAYLRDTPPWVLELQRKQAGV
jgi:hypothetical protein